MADLLSVIVDDTYIVVQHADGSVTAYRHGSVWRDLTGDNFVLAMAQKLEKYKAMEEACAHESNELPMRVKAAYEALDQ